MRMWKRVVISIGVLIGVCFVLQVLHQETGGSVTSGAVGFWSFVAALATFFFLSLKKATSTEKKQQREDKNELECLIEIAQQYADGKHGVTREYAMRCYQDYVTRGAYDRNRTRATNAALSKIRANIGITPIVIKTFAD